LVTPKTKTRGFVQKTQRWTNEKKVFYKRQCPCKNGKIAAIGNGLSDNAAVVIDAKENISQAESLIIYSHIAISNGVNEISHNSRSYYQMFVKL
jgi:hypothetical protein